MSSVSINQPPLETEAHLMSPVSPKVSDFFLLLLLQNPMMAAKRILIQTGPSSEERARCDGIGSQRSKPLLCSGVRMPCVGVGDGVGDG